MRKANSVDLGPAPIFGREKEPMEADVKRPDKLEIRCDDMTCSVTDPELEAAAASWWASTDGERRRERNVTGPRHLVSFSRPIHALARRAVTFWDGSPMPASMSKAKVVLIYQEALVSLCDRARTGVDAGSITLRDDLLGLRLSAPPLDRFAAWRQLRANAGESRLWEVSSTLVQAVLQDTVDLFPRVLIDPSEFSRWAVAEGIAVPDEVERLLSEAIGEINGLPERPSADEPPWKAKARAYADEIYERDRALGCEPSKESIAIDIAKRFAEEGIRGRNGRLDGAYIRRHALTAWQKPPRHR